MAAKKYLNESKEPDWEQRRYEIAKDVLPMIMRIECIAARDEGLDGGNIEFTDCAKDAIAAADELIKVLKGDNND